MIKFILIILTPSIALGQLEAGNFVLTKEIEKRIKYCYFEGPAGRQYFNDLPVETLPLFAKQLMELSPGASDGLYFSCLVDKYIQFQDSIQEPLKSEILAVIKAKSYNTNGSTDPKGFLINWEVNAHKLSPIKDPEIQAIVADLRLKFSEARAEHIRSQGIDPDTMLPFVTAPTPNPQVNVQSRPIIKPSPSPKPNHIKAPSIASDDNNKVLRRNALLASVCILILATYFFHLRKKRRSKL